MLATQPPARGRWATAGRVTGGRVPIAMSLLLLLLAPLGLRCRPPGSRPRHLGSLQAQAGALAPPHWQWLASVSGRQTRTHAPAAAAAPSGWATERQRKPCRPQPRSPPPEGGGRFVDPPPFCPPRWQMPIGGTTGQGLGLSMSAKNKMVESRCHGRISKILAMSPSPSPLLVFALWWHLLVRAPGSKLARPAPHRAGARENGAPTPKAGIQARSCGGGGGVGGGGGGGADSGRSACSSAQ